MARTTTHTRRLTLQRQPALAQNELAKAMWFTKCPISTLSSAYIWMGIPVPYDNLDACKQESNETLQPIKEIKTG